MFGAFRTTFVITAAVLTLGGAEALATERAGVAKKVQSDAFQSRIGIGFPVAANDEVFRQSRVYTQEYGTMDVLLDDGTSLTVAPNSSLTIDDYVYAGNQASGSLSISLAKGALRFVSGRMSSDSYGVKTTVATIGVRGTTFWLNDLADGKLEVWTQDGVVTASPVESDRVFTFQAPAYAVCSATTCEQGEAPPVPATFPLDPTEGGSFEGRGDKESEFSESGGDF